MILLLPLIVLADAELEALSAKAERDTLRVIVPINEHNISTGSGFIINKDGYVITNNHVTRDNRGLIILKNKYDEYKDITLIKTYPKHDITILKINNYNKGTFFKLQKPSTIKKGQDINTLGFPGGADLLEGLSFNATLSEGIIAKIDRATQGDFPPNYKFVQISATINKGNSGGPLFNNNGSIVGINTLGNGSPEVQGIFWAIHVEELIKVLKENDIKYTIDGSSLKRIEMIWIAFAALALVVLILFFILSRRKQETPTIDEDEMSRLVRDKMKKYGGDSSSEEYTEEEYMDESYYQEDEPRDTVVMGKPRESTHLMRIVLTPTQGTLPTITSANDEPITVGRGESCDIVISHAHISKEHLYLIIEKYKVKVIDLGSTNGTYIDGQKLEPHKKYALQAGQQLIIGSEDIIYGY